MSASNHGPLLDRVCSCLFVAGWVSFIARALHLVRWPWWCVLLPWLALLTVFLLTLLCILVVAAVQEWRSARDKRRAVAAVQEWRSARDKRRARERRAFHFEP